MRAWMAALPALVLTLSAIAAEPQGTPVNVTPEMRGAGAVASGTTLPAPPPVTGNEQKPVVAWSGPLPYPIVIADRRNNRLIEVAPDKRIVWEFPSPDLKIYRGNDDVFFSPDGKELMVNEEDNYDMHVIDYASRSLVWSYGEPDTKGTGANQFNFPDDAHLLPDGNIVVADIRNCRIMFVDRESSELKQQWGQPGTCRHDPPNFVDLPNGITPLDNGDFLITEIRGAWITRITRGGKVVWSIAAPGVRYPSDAYPTHDGQVIVADYSKPGRVVIFDPATGKMTWKYEAKSGEKMLNHPSLALELPNGNVILNDDWRNRVLVIDRKTREPVWQYGVTDQAGHTPGYLFYPDGMDIDVYHDWKTALGGK
jgi:DNA-binding beta-propeller fold protein YncE